MNAPREMLVLRKNYKKKSGLYTGRRFFFFNQCALSEELHSVGEILFIDHYVFLHISLDQRCLCNTWPSI